MAAASTAAPAPAAAAAFVTSLAAPRYRLASASATRALLPLPLALSPRRSRLATLSRAPRRRATLPCPRCSATPSPRHLGQPDGDGAAPKSGGAPDCVPDFAPARVVRSRLPRPLGLSLPSLLGLTAFAVAFCATHPAFTALRATLLALPAQLSSTLATLGTTRAALLLFGLNFCTVLFCFPANMGLMIAAGALLPSLPAFLALYLSKLCAAVVSFALARGLLAERASRWLARRRRLSKALGAAAGGSGWRLVFLLRLSPFPGFLLNYLLPLAGVPFGSYVAGTMAGIAPSVGNLVLIGSAARQAGNAVAGQQSAAAWLGAGVRAACAVSMIGVMFVVTRAVRAALDDADADVDGLTSSLADGLDEDEDEAAAAAADAEAVSQAVVPGETEQSDSPQATRVGGDRR